MSSLYYNYVQAEHHMALWRAHPLCYFELTTMLPRGVGSVKSEMPEIPGVDIKLSAR
jgi:hypothetical protein